jgi:hypothetical protein
MISSTMVAWIRHLVAKKIIVNPYSIFEFGPQDIAPTVYEGSAIDFYKELGAIEYHSADLHDKRNHCEPLDFNKVFHFSQKFDIVTNFGTAEHIFNIGNVFHSAHDLTKIGGLMLHVLPAFGDVDHGFYNIHPILYFELAKSNNYLIEDLSYVDRMNVRNAETSIDFDDLPIKRHMMDKPHFTGGQQQFNVTLTENLRHNAEIFGSYFSYDYCYVALRKQDDGEFNVPMHTYCFPR